jgi:hypothetical protein
MTKPTAVLAAAPVLAAGLLTVAAPAAQAAPGDCLEWEFGGPTAINVTGNFIPPDNDGFNLTFVAEGKTVDRPATMDSVPILGSTNGTMKGGINGTGVSLSFTSNQQSPVTVPLSGTIGPDGVASGGTGAPYQGGNWRTSAPLKCAKTEAEPPKSQPTVTSDTVIGGIVIHVKNNTDDTTNCHYDSEVVDRDFTLNPQATTDLRVVPAVPLFRDWNFSVTCDNDTSTTGKIFF